MSSCLKNTASPEKRRRIFVSSVAVDICDTEKKLNNQMCRVSAAALSELKRACRLLHGLAQLYVPNSPKHFESFELLMRVTAVLKKLGLAPAAVVDNLDAQLSDATNVVFASAEYRLLRNKYLAALATISDLAGRGVPPGSEDYQNGVREGYRRASEVAILFLEDAQIGEL